MVYAWTSERGFRKMFGLVCFSFFYSFLPPVKTSSVNLGGLSLSSATSISRSWMSEMNKPRTRSSIKSPRFTGSSAQYPLIHPSPPLSYSIALPRNSGHSAPGHSKQSDEKLYFFLGGCFLIFSLPRVANVKFPLQPHQIYYITQYEELGFS